MLFQGNPYIRLPLCIPPRIRNIKNFQSQFDKIISTVRSVDVVTGGTVWPLLEQDMDDDVHEQAVGRRLIYIRIFKCISERQADEGLYTNIDPTIYVQGCGLCEIELRDTPGPRGISAPRHPFGPVSSYNWMAGGTRGSQTRQA